MSSEPNRTSQSDSRRQTSEPADAPDQGYPQLPEQQPGLTGGPPTDAVPHSSQPLSDAEIRDRQRSLAAPLPGEENDGGEAILSSRPREVGGERPPKPR
jgi:hypothetical protein